MSDKTFEIEETRAADAPRVDGSMVLFVATGAAKGATIALPDAPGETLRIGKHKENDLVLPDDTVSRAHAAIERTAEGLRLRDLGSRNGTKIGKARVSEAWIAPGTVLRVGEVELHVRVESTAPGLPPSANERFGLALGRSLPMRRIFALLEKVAASNATVLLTGETGTGKDVLARSVHGESARKAKPFEVVDCGAITASLIESELFGHERGAFTGAVAARAGAFERAEGGTLFLDELGELPLDLQPKLLRVLEARELRRVGGQKTIPVDVRVIAATTKDLPKEVRAGRFREDLYFRLAVVAIRVPALRERLEDVPLLAKRMLDQRVGEIGLGIGDAVLARLASHDWPGNVRELRNVLERAAFLAHASGQTSIDHVELGPDELAAPNEAPEEAFRFRPGVTYREARAKVDALFERRYFGWLLERHGGNASAAAREAQMDRKYLAELARKHGLLR
jgi:transcriptional regulator with GAF, ATPase, and Fis domain